MDYSIKRSIISIKMQVDYACQHGMELSDCLAGSGIQTEDINNASYEVAPQQELAVVRNITQTLQPNFIHGYMIGGLYHLTSYGIWGFALTACKDIGEATQFALDHIDLTFAFCKISYQMQAGKAFFEFDNSAIPEDVREFLTLRDMVAFLNLHPEVLLQEVTPNSVELNLSSPEINPALLEQAAKCPVQLGCERNRVYFDPKLLELKLPHANSLTAEICKAQCKELLIRRRKKTSLTERIENILRTSQPIPTMEQVAEELHITSRTLHRQLKQQDTTWRKLLEKVRSDICLEMIYQGESNWPEISDRLGYSDTSNFIHAFKRWHGQTPSSFIKSIPKA